MQFEAREGDFRRRTIGTTEKITARSNKEMRRLRKSYYNPKNSIMLYTNDACNSISGTRGRRNSRTASGSASDRGMTRSGVIQRGVSMRSVGFSLSDTQKANISSYGYSVSFTKRPRSPSVKSASAGGRDASAPSIPAAMMMSRAKSMLLNSTAVAADDTAMMPRAQYQSLPRSRCRCSSAVHVIESLME